MTEVLRDRRWFGVTQAAEYAAVHPETIRRALLDKDSGLVGHQRRKLGHWRIEREALDEWLRGGGAA